MLDHELNQWHFECLYSALTPAKLPKYKTYFNDFIEEMWKPTNEQDVPPLEVAQVEECEDKAGRPPAVRVRLRLKIMQTQQGPAAMKVFKRACKRLCKGIFSSMLNRNLLKSLSLITDYALMGIEPLSPILKVTWTNRALVQAVTLEASVFRKYYEPTSFWPQWSKGMFIALIMVHESHFEGTDEPVNLKRLKSICSTAMSIVKAATGFARNQIDPKLCMEKEQLEKDFVVQAKKFERYQAEIERSDFSQIPSDMAIEIQELMIDINIIVYDLLLVTQDVGIDLLNLQNEQKWATATAASMGLTGSIACGASVLYSCALWACVTPAAIAVAAVGLTCKHYNDMNKHCEENLRIEDQRTELASIQSLCNSHRVAVMYPYLYPKTSGSEDVELSKTIPFEEQCSPSSASTTTTLPPLDLLENHQKELEGLADRFSLMGRGVAARAKWLKAVSEKEGQQLVDSFKVLRNDPDFKARWELPDEERPFTMEKQKPSYENIDQVAEEKCRMELMVQQKPRNDTTMVNARDGLVEKKATTDTSKSEKKATVLDDSELHTSA